MVSRQTGAHLAQSSLEIVALPLVVGGLLGVGLLWGTGVVIGSILGSTLPGSAGESVITMLGAFPEIGAAWEPAIPSLPIWAVVIGVIGMLAPVIWKLLWAGGLGEEGAQWATSQQLRRAGLLVADRPMPHAVAESAEVADAG